MPKVDVDKSIGYKIKHNLIVNDAEYELLMLYVDRVVHGEMKLSEYVDKFGSAYVDEKFWPLFKKEREHNKTEVKRHYKVLNTYNA